MRQRKIDGLSVVVFILALIVIGSSTATVLLCIHRFVGITEKVFLWYLVGITGPVSFIVTVYVTVCIHKQKNSKLLFWLDKNSPKLTIVWVMMIYTTVSLENTVSWTVEQVYNALSLQWTIFGLSMAIFLVWDGIVGDFLKSKQPRKPDQDDKMEKYKFLLKKQSFSEDVETTFSNIILLTVNLFLLLFSTSLVYIQNIPGKVYVQNIVLCSFNFSTGTIAMLFLEVLRPIKENRNKLLRENSVTKEEIDRAKGEAIIQTLIKEEVRIIMDSDKYTKEEKEEQIAIFLEALKEAARKKDDSKK